MKIRYGLLLWLFLVFSPMVKPASAHQPIMEIRTKDVTPASDPYDVYGSAMALGDPTFASYAVSGTLGPDSVDIYSFMAQHEDTIPIELLVPAKSRFAAFRPTLMVVGKYVANGIKTPSIIPIPLGFESITVPAPPARTTFYEPWSLTTFYHGEKQNVHILGGETYYLAVFDPNNQGGTYVISVGTKENFSGSVKDTAVPVDANNFVFENFPTRPRGAAPSIEERQLFPEQKTPFETLDSNIRLWADLFFFYTNRFIGLFTNT